MIQPTNSSHYRTNCACISLSYVYYKNSELDPDVVIHYHRWCYLRLCVYVFLPDWFDLYQAIMRWHLIIFINYNAFLLYCVVQATSGHVRLSFVLNVPIRKHWAFVQEKCWTFIEVESNSKNKLLLMLEQETIFINYRTARNLCLLQHSMNIYRLKVETRCCRQKQSYERRDEISSTWTVDCVYVRLFESDQTAKMNDRYVLCVWKGRKS